MLDLIEALQIFSKYTKARHPTCCEHDKLYVLVKPDKVSTEDLIRLEKLGFSPNEEDSNFYSFRFGSA